ncbi:hypothetical protein ABTZ03_20000 [Kitasatospora sp. NPDC096077]|uniref:hypothetical protein n=1 Tax=Kitasatospora sp. NPDC096077 TaxID=3155544 RepID=UPI00332CFF69
MAEQRRTISGDGQYAAYPVKWIRDVRITQHQLATGRAVSAGCSYSCDQPAFNADGRDVVFQSSAGGIVPGDANGKSQVFVRHFG